MDLERLHNEKLEAYSRENETEDYDSEENQE